MFNTTTHKIGQEHSLTALIVGFGNVKTSNPKPFDTKNATWIPTTTTETSVHLVARWHSQTARLGWKVYHNWNCLLGHVRFFRQRSCPENHQNHFSTNRRCQTHPTDALEQQTDRSDPTHSHRDNAFLFQQIEDDRLTRNKKIPINNPPLHALKQVFLDPTSATQIA